MKLVTRKVWRFGLDDTYVKQHDLLVKLPDFEGDYAKKVGDKLYVWEEYAWDGCSPRFRFFGLFDIAPWMGLQWKGKPQLYYASLVHDVLFQYVSEKGKENLKIINELFYLIALESKFVFAKQYRWVLKVYWRE